MTTKQHLPPFPAVEQVLTVESVARLNETRERLLQGRRFAISSGDILAQFRNGESPDSPPASGPFQLL
jgi:hypothetical protein